MPANRMHMTFFVRSSKGLRQICNVEMHIERKKERKKRTIHTHHYDDANWRIVLPIFTWISFSFRILMTCQNNRSHHLNGLHGANQQRKKHNHHTLRAGLTRTNEEKWWERISVNLTEVTAKQNAQLKEKILTPSKPTGKANTFYRPICRPVLYLFRLQMKFRFLVWRFLRIFFSSFSLASNIQPSIQIIRAFDAPFQLKCLHPFITVYLLRSFTD